MYVNLRKTFGLVDIPISQNRRCKVLDACNLQIFIIPPLSIMSATMTPKVFILVIVFYNVHAENVWPEKLRIMAC